MSARSITLVSTERWINANERMNWRKRSDLTRYWRALALLKAREARIPSFDRIRVIVTFHRADRRQFDPSNLAPTSKALVDGLVDAGVVPDDTFRHVIGPDERYGEPGVRRIVVLIEEAPDA